MSESDGQEELDLCAICLSTIDASHYTLECNHKFHTKCIVEWFRKSKGNCPLCNNNPITNSSNAYYGYNGRLVVDQRCGLIRRKYSRKKDCPPGLKKALLKLKDLETQSKEFSKEKCEFFKQPETIKYRKLMRHYSHQGKWKIDTKINKQKIKIITMLPGYAIT